MKSGMGLSGVVSWIQAFIHHEGHEKRRVGIALFLESKACFGFFNQTSRICGVTAPNDQSKLWTPSFTGAGVKDLLCDSKHHACDAKRKAIVSG
jgi:hypothetical protein